MPKKYNYTLPLLFAIFTALGMIAGAKYGGGAQSISAQSPYQQKLNQVIGYIERSYVDTPDREELIETAISQMLQDLDPYSSYIAARDLQHANEQLNGNFQGIGVEFSIIKDTITVMHPIPGGPSEKLGILPGDKIVKVNGENIAGIGIENTDVVRKLKGEKGTTVQVSIKRKGQKELIDFEITRDEIKIESVVATYMAASEIGYIKISRFAANTSKDFSKSLKSLIDAGAKELIVDLRSNPGGYLGTAIDMADEFLEKGELITYTQGRRRDRREYKASGDGKFKKGKLVVLINEGSASASEIFAGAMQDLDRGLIIGQRSHGKGLVQEPLQLGDGSQLRLTVARYYTPSGRCIQRDYDFTQEAGAEDSTAKHFSTRSGRDVIEGGGIIPDIKAPYDTANFSTYAMRLMSRGIIFDFVSAYTDVNRRRLISEFPEGKKFVANFNTSQDILDSLTQRAARRGIKLDTAGFDKSEEYLAHQIKALIARQLFDDNTYYQVLNSQDPSYKMGIEKLQNEQFSKFLKPQES